MIIPFYFYRQRTINVNYGKNFGGFFPRVLFSYFLHQVVTITTHSQLPLPDNDLPEPDCSLVRKYPI